MVPVAVSVYTFRPPAALSASSCIAGFWSAVLTLAYPILSPTEREPIESQ